MKRKLIFITLCLSLMLSLCLFTACENGDVPNDSSSPDLPSDFDFPNVTPSEGLEFALNDDGESYSVMGMGTCIDKDIIIPTTYESKPITSIGDGAFNNCTGLTSVTIPDSVTSIGIEAFCYCGDLTSITIPNSVTSIGGGSFAYCIGLTDITIPDSVTSVGKVAFVYCSRLESITVGNSNTKYHSKNNCLIETESKTLILGCKNSIIPDDGSITSIGFGAFCGCSSLTNITIPDRITSIGNWAFDGCSGLTNITIPDSVTSIGSSAFTECESLIEINFNGTKEQWNAIEKGDYWKNGAPAEKVICTDGEVGLEKSL